MIKQLGSRDVENTYTDKMMMKNRKMEIREIKSSDVKAMIERARR